MVAPHHHINIANKEMQHVVAKERKGVDSNFRYIYIIECLLGASLYLLIFLFFYLYSMLEFFFRRKEVGSL